jgi:hypothetical protein
MPELRDRSVYAPPNSARCVAVLLPGDEYFLFEEKFGFDKLPKYKVVADDSVVDTKTDETRHEAGELVDTGETYWH